MIKVGELSVSDMPSTVSDPPSVLEHSSTYVYACLNVCPFTPIPYNTCMELLYVYCKFITIYSMYWHFALCTCPVTIYFFPPVSAWAKRREELDRQEADLLSKVQELRQRLAQSSTSQSSSASTRTHLVESVTI